MSDQGPLSGSEERMSFDIRSTSAGAESTALVLDKKLTYKPFTETVKWS